MQTKGLATRKKGVSRKLTRSMCLCKESTQVLILWHSKETHMQGGFAQRGNLNAICLTNLNYLINEQNGISEGILLNYEKNKVEILTINKMVLFQTNLQQPNIHYIDD